MRTALRLWDGPLAGIAHVAGQFAALEEGPPAEDARQPPEDLAKALSSDLELLLSLAEDTQHVLYDAGGSESDFAVVPLILEPRLPAAAAEEEEQEQVEDDPAAPSSAAPAASHRGPGQSAPSEPSRAVLRESKVTALAGEGTGGSGSGGGGGCGGGGWWCVEAALAAPLTWGEVAASLGVAPELAAQMQPPLVFDGWDAFWSHMAERHIRKLAGGEAHEVWQPGGAVPTAASAPAGPAAVASGASGAAAGAASLTSGPGRSAGAGGGTEPSQLRSSTSAEAMSAAVRRLGGAVRYPVLQVVLGSEALGWNPIPLMWLGRSRRSGAIIGLLTAVVWT